MDKLIETRKSYKEIFKVLDKHKDIHTIDIKHLKYKSELHLFSLELKEIYGLNMGNIYMCNLDWIDCGEYVKIGRYGEKHNRTIGWSDDDSQPEDEILVSIGFCTGAYVFDSDYPTDFFQKFFQELKSYGPKYCDSTNKKLYFTLDNSREVFNNFSSILNKYHDLNKEDRKQRKILKMEKELLELKN